jgi:ribosomal protein S18 acetylase RimI-like enzyme
MTMPTPSPYDLPVWCHGGMDVTFRRAVASDVPAVVALLADDQLGAARESLRNPGPYRDAFAVIDGDPNQMLVVGESAGRVLATLQLTFIPGLSHRGGWRAQIEAVRVDASARGAGIGEHLMRWAIDQARARGCALVQLTSNVSRTDAHRFYDRLGFVASHTGFKLAL